MADDKKLAPEQLEHPTDPIADGEEFNPLDHDPEQDDLFLKTSEEFFQKDDPKYYALLKRVRGTTTGA